MPWCAPGLTDQQDLTIQRGDVIAPGFAGRLQLSGDVVL